MSLRQLPSKHCECSPNGRNLVVCIDGTSNQFGAKNTNVIEIYSQLIKSGEQLTYYNSGIGTYAKPSWSWNYVKQAIDNAIDLAIAWNFERTVMAAYRWLSDNYQEGDRIYLFGFSRGAYQVRALAGMIQKVGLIYRGNEEQIPFAYELYYFRLAPQPVQPEPIDLAQRFKSTFSRENVSVHFVGVWDTVSSVGIVRGKNLPLTDTVDHVCFFRHALALDERRVKFLPEYAIYEQDRRPAISKGLNQDPSTRPPPPHIKEVWFPGTHSDIGGGNQLNVNLDLGRTPGIWMMSEAIGSGALLRPKKVEWDWQNLDVVKESLTGIWYPFEWIPFKRLSYEDSTSTTYQ
ncbi:hypothetical protein CPB86DRAFT_710764 [Serendipita vermifera]|nr:hypothetical protein CPB86DRAFT_710764 [Serendipita vermifera]